MAKWNPGTCSAALGAVLLAACASKPPENAAALQGCGPVGAAASSSAAPAAEQAGSPPMAAAPADNGTPFATRYARFEPVAFSSLPGWGSDSQQQSLTAFRQSCQALKHKPVWSDLCPKADTIDPSQGAQARVFFEQNFHVYSVQAPGAGPDGVITGYFEPLLNGSLSRNNRYSYPVYGIPSDLLFLSARAISGEATQWFTLAERTLTPAQPGAPGARQYTLSLGDAEPNIRDKRFRVAIVGNAIRPYYTRQELEGRDVRAQVFAWVDDPAALYSMQVQGSGKIRLANGEIVRVAYAEQNGYPFLPHVSSDDLLAASSAIKTRGLKLGADSGGGASADFAAPAPASAPPAAQSPEVAALIAQLKGGGHPAPPPQSAAPAPASGDVASMIAALKQPAHAAPAPAAATDGGSGIEYAPTNAGPSTGIQDPSYVFFRRIPDGPQGPTGALGVPLTAGRSIAVDPRTTPLGYPVFLAVGGSDGKTPATDRLMFAQDTGGAIRGPVRADFFFGFGQQAGAQASSMNDTGRMWLLIPRGLEIAELNPATRTRALGGTSNAECVIPDPQFCVEN